MTQFIIYKIYWTGIGYYFGKTRGFRKRRNRHFREMENGTHHNKKLVKMYARHGKPKMKICAFANSDEELHVLEKNFLQAYKGNRQCLNHNF